MPIMPKRPRTGDSVLKSNTSSIENKPSRWSLGQFGRNVVGKSISSSASSSSNSSPLPHISSHNTITTTMNSATTNEETLQNNGNRHQNPSLSPCENGNNSGIPFRQGLIGVNECEPYSTNGNIYQSNGSYYPYENGSSSKIASAYQHQMFNNRNAEHDYSTSSYPVDAQQMYVQQISPAAMTTFDQRSPIMDAYSSTPFIRSNIVSTGQLYHNSEVGVVIPTEMDQGFVVPSFASTKSQKKYAVPKVAGTDNLSLMNDGMWATETIHDPTSIYSMGMESDLSPPQDESEQFNNYDATYSSNGSRPSRQASTQTSYSSDSIGADEDMFKNEKTKPTTGKGTNSQTINRSSRSKDEVKRHRFSVFQVKPLHALNEYEPLVTLGTGTFGRVILVRLRSGLRSDPRSYFALKVLDKSDIIRLKQVAHTNNERDVLSKVHHPFIVNLFSTFQDEKNCYMLMEYVIGGEVFSHLRKARRFSTDVTRFYISCLVLALAYLHSEKVLYRDLKPENLLLDGDGYIKIADFGFAKNLSKQERTWTLCGTPEYLSPEVIQSQGQSFASDYWALGILMYEMICGFPPFYDKTPFGTYEAILSKKIAFPSHVDECSKDLIKSFLTRDVTKRLGNLSGGANDVIRHPWFDGVDWQALLEKRIPAPIIPVQFHAGDTGNFQKYDQFDITKMPALQQSQQQQQPQQNTSITEEYIQSQFVDF